MTFPYAQSTEFVTALKAAVVEEQHKNAMLTKEECELEEGVRITNSRPTT